MTKRSSDDKEMFTIYFMKKKYITNFDGKSTLKPSLQKKENLEKKLF